MTYTNDARPGFEKAKEHLNKELNGIRTGRATPALVEDIPVEAYGTVQPLKSLASISTPDSKTVQMEPWDPSVVKAIESAIMKANLGINPTVDGRTIRLNMPMMTEETRQQMVKKMKEKLEEARVAVRRVREETKKKIEKDDSLPEDEQHRQLEELDKKVKEMNGEIEDLGNKKEQEITTI
ncbi:ribosome recycling factor [Patescibacteria group bacterium]|nr:ribosome recycling factor [Patescibacteria group bacterium]